MYLNAVYLIGNLTRDPEVRYTAGGTPICDFGLAVSRKGKSADGQDREEVCFLDVSRMGKGADSLARYLGKGIAVLVEGSLKFDSWKDKNGNARSRLNVMANRVEILSRPRNASSSETPNNSQPQTAHRYSDADKTPQGTGEDLAF